MSKEVVEKEVKEKKTKTKKTDTVSSVKFNQEQQSRLKFVSKFVYILAKIGKVVAIIAGIGILIAIICAPVIVKNVKVENNKLTVYGEEVHYVHEGNNIILKYNNVDIGTLSGEEANEFDNAITELEKVDIPAIFGVCEFYLVVAFAMCVIMYIIMTNVDKLFTNIYNKDTPFNEENTEFIRKITRLVIVLAVGPYICGLIGQILLRSSLIHFEINLSDLFFVLILFTVTYVFEYGCELQKDTNAKIYD